MRYLFGLLFAGILISGCGDKTGTSAPIITTEDGTRYSLFTDGRTGEVVSPGDYVYFHSSMRTEGDSILGGTRDNGGIPQELQIMEPGGANKSPLDGVLRVMAQGDSAVIRLPMDMFPSAPPGLEADSVLLYTIALTEVVDEETYASRQSAEQQAAMAAAKIIKAREPEMLAFGAEVVSDYTAGKLDGELQTTESGLKYIIHEEGTGTQAEAGRGVTVQYIGMLTSNGNVFDQSFGRGEGIEFPLGRGAVIAGWDEGIALLKEGARATLFIPSSLGYGERGAGADIPPNSELAFYVELEKVQ